MTIEDIKPGDLVKFALAEYGICLNSYASTAYYDILNLQDSETMKAVSWFRIKKLTIKRQ